MRPYNLFLDDLRTPSMCKHYMYGNYMLYTKMDWIIVKNFNEFIKTIEIKYQNGYFPSIVSFDHDLADFDMSGSEKTGMDCAKWLINFCMDNNVNLPKYIIHSQNGVGKINIESILDQYKKFSNE